ncbi:hypothetical protein [Altibacter sp. HG106]|uniref:hypothetical protein n=1 Tax=Altibacter sp. HG106 TaxID=3023937 RepID=UPI002350650E|nr:hypothetical protein [Altibacter sp. HG106]MDC7993535.1 hypothetical protein [Altibacter sp. HG106]
MEKTRKQKKHADFQDAYRRSSNFNKTTKKEDFQPGDNGELTLAQKEERDAKKIADAMKHLEDEDTDENS